MPPLRSLVVGLLLAAFLAHSLPQDGPTPNSRFTFADKSRVLASRVSGHDLTRPRRQSSPSRLVNYSEGSGKLEYKDERDVDVPGSDSVGLVVDTNGRSCPGDDAYTCVSGDMICSVSVCDGIEDCPGGDDEQDCEHCHDWEFRCRDGSCIDKRLCCNGCRDCPDGSDEFHCWFRWRPRSNEHCRHWEFRCRDGWCINKGLHCNGFRDCPDGSDELHCRGR